ncbi:hypothetical protein P7B02_03675 [Caulobacter segnis]|uniref:hypothetical protein n=1 Tax=Caulobacter segnis TaxID=88688 RepID=UPI00240F35FE|nr:hypothetical protein [Caulobacter segnis]MDG2520631.1 hypothetical protein [Caulobacter segnis]
MARLKTFVTSDGLTDYIVAATSRPKALAAWDVHQDLFKSGAARETDEPELVKAAARTPGQVVERPAGGRRGPVRIPKVRASTKNAKAQSAARRQIKSLTDKLAALEARTQAAREDIARRRDDLDAEAQTLEAAFEKENEALTGRLAQARRKARG